MVDECGDELIFEEDHSEEDNMFAGQCTIEHIILLATAMLKHAFTT